VAMLGYYTAVSVPDLRARTAAQKWYPSNFAGWGELAEAVRLARAQMPGDTRIVAGSFKLGAELGFALGEPRIAVLDHPLNHKHGRAPQLRLWGLQSRGIEEWGDRPVLLVISPTDVQYKELLSRYHDLCAMVGPLPPPQVINVDHGRQRFLLFRMNARAPLSTATCTAPGMAWIDAPVGGASVDGRFAVRGWAFKDGVGVEGVEVTLDGQVVAEADYGLDSPGVAGFWRISTDPNHPRVGFEATVDASTFEPGRHWLGLRLHGSDGSIEAWPEQPIEIE